MVSRKNWLMFRMYSLNIKEQKLVYVFVCNKSYFLSKLFPWSCIMWKVLVHGTEQKLFLFCAKIDSTGMVSQLVLIWFVCFFARRTRARTHTHTHRHSVVPGFEVLFWVKSLKVLLKFEHDFKSLWIEPKNLFLSTQQHNILVPSGTKWVKENPLVLDSFFKAVCTEKVLSRLSRDPKSHAQEFRYDTGSNMTDITNLYEIFNQCIS